MAKGDKRKVESALDDLLEICDDTTCLHESVLGLLARDEVEKHEMRFKAKLLPNNECVAEVKLWLSCNKATFFQNEIVEDIVSNVESSCSSKSSRTSSSRLKAEVNKAALVACMAVLK